MPNSPWSVVLRHLGADPRPDGAGGTDGELWARFLANRDGAALAALVRRHAPMVWGVCRRLLPHHDAEDAFQATFLVLVRKAAAVPGQAVANWLYGVARQTAVRLRATAAKRGRREVQMASLPEPAVAEGRDADLRAVLDEELARLPGHYRAALVLCDLEGLTRREAARHLGIPEGSVASRLARARALLARRLTRRGVVTSTGAVAAVGAMVAAPAALVASTIQAARLLAAGRAAGVLPTQVAALTEGVVQAMFVTKIKGVLAVVLVAGLALAGAAGLLHQAPAAEPPTAKGGPPAAPKDRPMSDEPQAPGNRPPAKSDQERLVGGWVIVNADSGRQGEPWIISQDEITTYANLLGFRVYRHFHRLDPTQRPKHIDLTVTKTNLEPVGVIKGLYELDRGELRLCLAEMGQDRPAAFPAKPKVGEVLVLHGPEFQADGAATGRAKLRTLIDQVLAAHGGEDQLSKLRFTMTVQHANGETQRYFVQPPNHFRWETTHRDRTGKRIVLLFPEGRRWWTQEPNEAAREFIPLGAEPRVEYWLDYVKFFGPRQVLRLKDPDHQVALLDEEATIGGRAAVGVAVTGPRFTLFKGTMYFDKVTHRLLKSGAVTYSDYQTFDGIPVARKEDDGHLMPQITAFQVVDKFDPTLFERP